MRGWSSILAKIKQIFFCIEHLFVSIYLFVWPFTGFINHDDESKHGNICEEVGEDHDDVENHDLEEKQKKRSRNLSFSNLKLGPSFQIFVQILLVLFLGFR